jgi:hypothetical protein
MQRAGRHGFLPALEVTMAKPYVASNMVENEIATGNTWTRGTDTSIVLTDGTDFDSGGGYIRIGTSASYALMEYTGKTSNTLTGLTPCTLGNVVTAGDETKEWPAGTIVARQAVGEELADRDTLLSKTDFPAAYTDYDKALLRVNDTPDGVEFMHPRVARAYMAGTDAAGNQLTPASSAIRMLLDGTVFDEFGMFNTDTWAGSATSTSSGKLVDSAASFPEDIGMPIVWNRTDNTYTFVTARDSATQLTLDADIMANGEDYVLYHSQYIVKETGIYLIVATATFDTITDGIPIQLLLRVNNGIDAAPSALSSAFAEMVASRTGRTQASLLSVVSVTAGQGIAIHVQHDDTGNVRGMMRDTVAAGRYCWMSVMRVL